MNPFKPFVPEFNNSSELSSFSSRQQDLVTSTNNRQDHGNDPKLTDLNKFLLDLDENNSFFDAEVGHDDCESVKAIIPKGYPTHTKTLVSDIEQRSLLLYSKISIEANFSLEPLVLDRYRYKQIRSETHISRLPSSIESAIAQLQDVTMSWNFPSKEHSVRDAALHNSGQNFFDKNEAWPLNRSDYESKDSASVAAAFVKSTAVRWQEALNSLLDELLANAIKCFYILDNIDDTNKIHRLPRITATFYANYGSSDATERSSFLNGEVNNQKCVGEPCCILVGMSKPFIKRLSTLGCKIYAIKSPSNDDSDRLNASTSTRGLSEAIRKGETVFVSGRLDVSIAAHCITEMIFNLSLPPHQILFYNLPSLVGYAPFLHAVAMPAEMRGIMCTAPLERRSSNSLAIPIALGDNNSTDQTHIIDIEFDVSQVCLSAVTKAMIDYAKVMQSNRFMKDSPSLGISRSIDPMFSYIKTKSSEIASQFTRSALLTSDTMYTATAVAMDGVIVGGNSSNTGVGGTSASTIGGGASSSARLTNPMSIITTRSAITERDTDDEEKAGDVTTDNQKSNTTNDAVNNMVGISSFKPFTVTASQQVASLKRKLDYVENKDVKSGSVSESSSSSSSSAAPAAWFTITLVPSRDQRVLALSSAYAIAATAAAATSKTTDATVTAAVCTGDFGVGSNSSRSSSINNSSSNSSSINNGSSHVASSSVLGSTTTRTESDSFFQQYVVEGSRAVHKEISWKWHNGSSNDRDGYSRVQRSRTGAMHTFCGSTISGGDDGNNNNNNNNNNDDGEEEEEEEEEDVVEVTWRAADPIMLVAVCADGSVPVRGQRAREINKAEGLQLHPLNAYHSYVENQIF